MVDSYPSRNVCYPIEPATTVAVIAICINSYIPITTSDLVGFLRSSIGVSKQKENAYQPNGVTDSFMAHVKLLNYDALGFSSRSVLVYISDLPSMSSRCTITSKPWARLGCSNNHAIQTSVSTISASSSIGFDPSISVSSIAIFFPISFLFPWVKVSSVLGIESSKNLAIRVTTTQIVDKVVGIINSAFYPSFVVTTSSPSGVLSSISPLIEQVLAKVHTD